MNMKISTAIFVASVASASAFVPNTATHKAFASIHMSESPENEVLEEQVTTEAPSESLLTKAELPETSTAMPFMARPPALDGSMAGDVGFDPLGFAKSEEDLMNYREAEIKHARLAMLAAAGWPLSEVFDKKIAGAIGLTPVLDATDRAPSVLNGGLGKVSPVYWIGCLAVAAAIDLYGISRKQSPDYFPGNLGFDPLGLYPQDEEGRMRMETAEIKNGRLAMIAITAFAAQEFVTKMGVVDETPFFFKPFGQMTMEYANTGYIMH